MWKMLKHGLWTVLSMYASCDTIVSINVAHNILFTNAARI